MLATVFSLRSFLFSFIGQFYLFWATGLSPTFLFNFSKLAQVRRCDCVRTSKIRSCCFLRILLKSEVVIPSARVKSDVVIFCVSGSNPTLLFEVRFFDFRFGSVFNFRFQIRSVFQFQSYFFRQTCFWNFVLKNQKKNFGFHFAKFPFFLISDLVWIFISVSFHPRF